MPYPRDDHPERHAKFFFRVGQVGLVPATVLVIVCVAELFFGAATLAREPNLESFLFVLSSLLALTLFGWGMSLADGYMRAVQCVVPGEVLVKLWSRTVQYNTILLTLCIAVGGYYVRQLRQHNVGWTVPAFWSALVLWFTYLVARARTALRLARG